MFLISLELPGKIKNMLFCHEVVVSWTAHFEIMHAYHGLGKCLLDQVDAALVHGLTIGEEAALKGGGHRGQTLSGTGSRGHMQSAACPYQCQRGESLGLTLRCITCSFYPEHLWLTSNKGKRSLSSSFSWFHFWMSGGINIWMYSCKNQTVNDWLATLQISSFQDA